MKNEFTLEIDPGRDGICIESVKVELNKCDIYINGEMGRANIYGRRVQKSVVFPVAKLNYSGDECVANRKYNRIIDLKDAALTDTNFEGAGCGMIYFIVSNGQQYSLYDVNGRFIRHIPISEYGRIICLGVSSFVTLSETGIIRLWNYTGKHFGEIPATPENMKRYAWQKGKLIKKSESYCQCYPDDDNDELYS